MPCIGYSHDIPALKNREPNSPVPHPLKSGFSRHGYNTPDSCEMRQCTFACGFILMCQSPHSLLAAVPIACFSCVLCGNLHVFVGCRPSVMYTYLFIRSALAISAACSWCDPCALPAICFDSIGVTSTGPLLFHRLSLLR